MTVVAAWVGRRKDGREHLYIASDSRVSGGQRLDVCPKIMMLPRSDCALCFAGDTATTYPLMLQLGYAIAAHEPARERNLDIARVKAHLLRVFTDVVNRIADAVARCVPFAPHVDRHLSVRFQAGLSSCAGRYGSRRFTPLQDVGRPGKAEALECVHCLPDPTFTRESLLP